MSKNTEDKKALERFQTLTRRRREILELAPQEALDAILDSPAPAALVHSFADDDFYFLIHDIGIEDSLELLSLASDRQWEHIIDMEVWGKDRIDIHSTTRWLDLLLKVNPGRFIKWALDEKSELLEFYLSKNIEVKVRESDQDPSEFGQEFVTLDDTIYYRFRKDVFDPDPNDAESDDAIKEQRNAFITNLCKKIAEYNLTTYQKVLLESENVIPAETEEEAYRLRNVRLAEKGFLPVDQAVGIYQPLTPQDFEAQEVKYTAEDEDRRLFLPVPLYPMGMLKEENLFTRALQQIDIDPVLEQVQTEFAGLCNQIVVADQKIIRDREALREIIKKACGYINIGLERLTAEGTVPDTRRAAALLQKYSLADIFRVGFGGALELKWRVERWRETSWFEKEGLLLSFWDEEGMGVLGGLLIKKPLFYDNYQTGVLYREFVSTEDIERTEKIVSEIIEIDTILSQMDIKPEPVSDGFLTHKNVLLTLWARHYLGLSKALVTLTLDEFKQFFNNLWAAGDMPRQTSLAMKEAFLSWLSDQSGFSPYEVSQKLANTLENLFREIEKELGEVSSQDLDPGFIRLFLIKTKSP
jgi:hypothetical protein